MTHDEPDDDAFDLPAGGALFQIAEPEPERASGRTPGRAVGIDLGTTHSLVAVAPLGAAPRVLRTAPPDAGTPLLASVVAYGDGNPLVGEAALARAVEDPTRVIRSVKRFMGRGREEIRFAHPYRLAEAEAGGAVRFDVGTAAAPRHVTPIEVSAEILRALKRRAEAELGHPVERAVITVPAYFDDAQRQATKDAARVAGLKVDRLLAEPTAAALAYGLDRREQGLFAVYDLGGGTFDVSVLRLTQGVFQVLATGGDSALGGDDFDRALAEAWLARLPATAQPLGPSLRTALERAARRAKEQLSAVDEVEVALAGWPTAGGEPLRFTATRAELEAAIEPLVRVTLTAARKALQDAGVRARELDGVVLVGGSTRVPLVRQRVREAFGREPLTDIDPDEVVAHGAAIQADVLSGSAREGVTLLDVVPLSLGIETMGGIVEQVIPRNATIPIAARQVFTNYSERQTGMVIHVVQGERELAAHNRSLARFELKGIPALPPSMARIEVTFELDADALLTVSAKELHTGVRQSVQVRPTYGLDDAEVDRLVMDSLDHADEDFAARDLAEARVELGRVVLAVRKALEEQGRVPGLLDDPTERAAIEAALAAGHAAMTPAAMTPAAAGAAGDATPGAAGDAREIHRLREQLERASEPFARRRMERALQAGMTGRAVDAIESAIDAEPELAARRGAHHAEAIPEPDAPAPAPTRAAP